MRACQRVAVPQHRVHEAGGKEVRVAFGFQCLHVRGTGQGMALSGGGGTRGPPPRPPGQLGAPAHARHVEQRHDRPRLRTEQPTHKHP